LIKQFYVTNGQSPVAQQGRDNHQWLTAVIGQVVVPRYPIWHGSADHQWTPYSSLRSKLMMIVHVLAVCRPDWLILVADPDSDYQ